MPSLNPVEFYHGSDHQFRPGERLLPSSLTGKSNWEGEAYDRSQVYLASTPHAASRYGRNIYRVVPEGVHGGPAKVVPDPEHIAAGIPAEENDQYMARRARVVGVHDPAD